MNSRALRWFSVLGGVVLIGGGLLANYGAGVPSAGAQSTPPNPLTEILKKLNQIQEGNHTLRWDQALPAAQRFVILAAFNNEAVLDKNTGLVWEKSPTTTPDMWSPARVGCANKNVGNQKGWRLPAVAELASLIDPSVPSPGPTLPPGHPFLNVVHLSEYWSASSLADNPEVAWDVRFADGRVGTDFKTRANPYWCVRGGMQESVY